LAQLNTAEVVVRWLWKFAEWRSKIRRKWGLTVTKRPAENSLRQLLERERQESYCREGENERCVMCLMFSEQENAVQVCEMWKWKPEGSLHLRISTLEVRRSKASSTVVGSLGALLSSSSGTGSGDLCSAWLEHGCPTAIPWCHSMCSEPELYYVPAAALCLHSLWFLLVQWNQNCGCV
jgi:hypothetical protein